jgi:hypothetical protein
VIISLRRKDQYPLFSPWPSFLPRPLRSQCKCKYPYYILVSTSSTVIELQFPYIKLASIQTESTLKTNDNSDFDVLITISKYLRQKRCMVQRLRLVIMEPQSLFNLLSPSWLSSSSSYLRLSQPHPHPHPH